MPRFANRAEEAAWWEANEQAVARAFEKALDEGYAGPCAVVVTDDSTATKIRLGSRDVAKAHKQALKLGLRCQDYLKTILCEAVRSARSRRGGNQVKKESKTKNRKLSRNDAAEAVGREFASAVDSVFVSLQKMSYRKALRTLRLIEASFIVKLPSRSKSRRELRRRIAELSLEQALTHGCDLRECRTKLTYLEILGWSTVDKKLFTLLLYARGMVVRRHFLVARAVTQQGISASKQRLRRIEGKAPRRGRKYFLNWIESFQEVLAEIERTAAGHSPRWDLGGGPVRT